MASQAKGTYPTTASFEVKELPASENRRRAIVEACTALKADALVLGALGAGAVRRGEEKVPFDEQRYQVCRCPPPSPMERKEKSTPATQMSEREMNGKF